MLNIFNCAGRIVRDPELRKTQNGTSVCSFTVAVDRDSKDADGNKATDFFDVVAWKATAEFVATYTKKGSLVIVAGRLQNRDWTDKNGDKRRSTEVVANSVYFAESKKKDDPMNELALKAEKFTEVEDDGELPF